MILFVLSNTIRKTLICNGHGQPIGNGHRNRYCNRVTNDRVKAMGACPLPIVHICNGYLSTTVTENSNQ